MNCKEIEKKISGYLDKNLSDSHLREFEEHVKACRACHAEVTAFKEILAEAATFEKVSAPNTLWTRIEHELDAPGKKPFWVKLFDRYHAILTRLKAASRIPVPMVRVAGVVGILAAGIFLGRHFFPAVENDVIAPGAAVRPAEARFISSRAEHYFEKSKILFLGIVNTESVDEENSSWKSEKRVARNLVKEAAFLKGGLSRMRNERLKRLVEELELILLEIANLEEQQNIDNIELIKSGIDRNGLLLKIYLHD